MLLQSVVDLKAELRGIAAAGEGFVKKASTSLPRPRTLGVFLGVTPGTGPQGFLLAVRTTRTDAAVREYLNTLDIATSSEIDVQHVGEIQAMPPGVSSVTWTGRVRPLLPGYSVAHAKGTAGTIGGFVKINGSKDVHLLSNSHVLALWGGCTHGDAILQPGPLDGGLAAEAVAKLHGYVPLAGVNYVDAAVGRLENQPDFEALYDGKRLGSPYDPSQSVAAWKVGRTTGITKGRVTALAQDDVPVSFGSTVAYFDGQIEIAGEGGPFSMGGDSGSLIMDDTNNPYGLVFAASVVRGTTYANPLPLVLQLLDATLLS